MTAVEDIEKASLQRSGLIAAVPIGDVGTISAAQLQPVLDEILALRPEFQFAAVADVQGTTRAISPVDPSIVGRDFSFRDWFHGVMRTH